MSNYIGIIRTIQFTVGYHCGEEWSILFGCRLISTFLIELVAGEC